MPDRELSANEVRLLRDLLVPQMQQIVREEFDAVREEMRIGRDRIDTRIDLLATRVTNLEGVKAKVMLAYGAIVAMVTLAYYILKDWFIKHVWK